MNMAYFIDKVTQYLSWFFQRQWERWELAVAAIAALGLVILLVRARQKVAANSRLYRERSPIIGIELAQSRRRPGRIKISQKSRPAPVAQRHTGEHAKEHIKERVAELESAEERLQHDPIDRRQDTEHFKQQ
jgi:C4-dicarboxylate-specific signal transduction histidine kinase